MTGAPSPGSDGARPAAPGRAARALVALVFLALPTVAQPGVAAGGDPVSAATPPRSALFALVIGVNDGAEAGQPPLRYADDDAARYFDLFRALGARVHLLAEPDENTRRLHAQAAAEATPPTPEGLVAAATALATEVARARERGVPTRLYVVYAGHGSVQDDVAGLTLVGGRLTAQALADIVGAVGAGRSHVIVDACDAWAFAYAGSRGPGGERRAVRGFAEAGPLVDAPGVGLLLGASATRETHEWEAVQAGVFSHVVRSGLYGAADADGDGRVGYREIAAFVDRAGEAIPNERYRPAVHVRPPSGSGELLDLEGALERRVELDGERAHGRFFLENPLGVRLVDFHNAAGQPVRLLRPSAEGLLYLRATADGREYSIPGNAAVVRVADRSPTTARTRARGAAHEAFQSLFALPFDAAVVEAWAPRPAVSLSGPADGGPNGFSTAYVLRSGVLEGAGLAHGVSLAYARALGRWRPRVAFAWTTARYDVGGALDVVAHEVGGTLGLDVELVAGRGLALLVGLQAGGGWVWQRGEGAGGASQERDGGVLRYRGAIVGEWAPIPALAFIARGAAGQAFVDAAGGWQTPFEAELEVGLEARF